MRKILSILLLVCFFMTNIGGGVPLYASSTDAKGLLLPAPGMMVHTSPSMNPLILKAIKVHTDDPFHFDFVLDKGDSSTANEQELKAESSKLIKYFLASLTIPEKDLWVNLSPYEKDRIVPESFGVTEMGRDLLAEDYMLKQITASLIYPEGETGKKFWKRIYEEAQKKYGNTNIPVNTFNKVWIVPEKALVYENAKAGTAYVVESKLKVMLEEDYLSLEKHGTVISDTHALGSQIVREIVIPELTKEVNEGKNFAQLRQVYNSLILATWYKKKIKDSIFSKVYADRSKTQGVNIDNPQEKEKIYQQYLKAFKKGVYNYIKDEPDPITNQTIPRKYFSGGIGALNIREDVATTTDAVRVPQFGGPRFVQEDVRMNSAMNTNLSSNSSIAALQIALEDVLSVYANVHRGAGPRSQASTELFEHAREEALRFAGKKEAEGYVTIFNNQRNTQLLVEWLKQRGKSYQVFSSDEFGLSLGVYALVVKKEDLPDAPLAPGGGTVRAATEVEIRWADAPDRFEAGTPNIVGIILFGKILQLARQEGNNDIFKNDRTALTKEDVHRLLYEDEFKTLTGEALWEEIQKTFISRDEGVHVDHGASNSTFGLVGNIMSEVLSHSIDEETRQELVKEVENILRRFINAKPADYDVVFTSSTTDASNILMTNVIENIKRLKRDGKKVAILGSQIEHNSSRLPYLFNAYLQGEDRSLSDVEYLSLTVNEKGFFDLDEFERILCDHNTGRDPAKAFIPFMQITAASNVLGSLNNMKRMVEIAHKYGVMIAIDGAQYLAHKKIDMENLGADFILFSSHKAYAPGSGALLIRQHEKATWSKIPVEELDGLKKKGVENLVGLAAFGKSLNILGRIGMDTVVSHEQRITRDLIDKLKGLGDQVKVYGETDNLSLRAGVVTVTFQDYPVDLAAKWLAQDANVGSREGCFCSPTAVFQGVGYDFDDISALITRFGGENIGRVSPRMLRLSLGLSNTEEDNDRIIASLKRLFALKPNALEKALAKRFAQSPPAVIDAVSAGKYAQTLGVETANIYEMDQEQRLSVQIEAADNGAIQRLVHETKHAVFGPDAAMGTNDVQTVLDSRMFFDDGRAHLTGGQAVAAVGNGRNMSWLHLTDTIIVKFVPRHQAPRNFLKPDQFKQPGDNAKYFRFNLPEDITIQETLGLLGSIRKLSLSDQERIVLPAIADKFKAAAVFLKHRYANNRSSVKTVLIRTYFALGLVLDQDVQNTASLSDEDIDRQVALYEKRANKPLDQDIQQWLDIGGNEVLGETSDLMDKARELSIRGVAMELDVVTFWRGFALLNKELQTRGLARNWFESFLSRKGFNRAAAYFRSARATIEAAKIRVDLINANRAYKQGSKEIVSIQMDAIKKVLEAVFAMPRWILDRRTIDFPKAAPVIQRITNQMLPLQRCAWVAKYLEELGFRDIFSVGMQDHIFLLVRLANGRYLKVEPSADSLQYSFYMDELPLPTGVIPTEGVILDLNGVYGLHVVSIAPWKRGLAENFYLDVKEELERRGDLKAAEELSRRAIELVPTDSEAYANLATTLLKQKRDQEAEQVLRKAIALDPRNSKILINLGVALAKMGRIDEARDMFLSKTVKDHESRVIAFYNLGASLEMQADSVLERGDKKTAEDLYDKSLSAYRIALEVNVEHKLSKDAVVRVGGKISRLSAAMNVLDASHAHEGGINMNSKNMDLQIQTMDGEIKFHLDPAQLAQFKNTIGFYPVIINVQPMNDLRGFLGINEPSLK